MMSNTCTINLMVLVVSSTQSDPGTRHGRVLLCCPGGLSDLSELLKHVHVEVCHVVSAQVVQRIHFLGLGDKAP